jgi:DNA-binding MarR family transcriptional regulator
MSERTRSRKVSGSRARTGGTKAKYGEVADHIHSAAIHLLRGLRRQDDKWGLSAPRLSALSVIVFAGPITLGELARAEQVRPPTMTKLVRALESAGLVTRKLDARDRRISRISATTRGRRLLHKGREERVRALARRLGTLSTDEIRSLDKAARLIESVASGL